MTLPDNTVILYQSPDGLSTLEVHLDHETVCLTQPQLADLVDVSVPAISKHIRNILGSGELGASAKHMQAMPMAIRAMVPAIVLAPVADFVVKKIFHLRCHDIFCGVFYGI